MKTSEQRMKDVYAIVTIFMDRIFECIIAKDRSDSLEVEFKRWEKLAAEYQLEYEHERDAQ